MVWLSGLAGLIGGFMAGQLLLMFLLRHKSNREILGDRSIRWVYGLVNWAVAALGVWVAVSMYSRYAG